RSSSRDILEPQGPFPAAPATTFAHLTHGMGSTGMKKLMVVVGTRPNFIKVTRFKAEAAKRGMEVQLVHTGQHYDEKMSTVFFDQFGLRPDRFLDTPHARPAAQMGHIMIALEAAAEALRPDLMIVPGDVNSTLAGALVANKMGIPLAHL